MKLEENIEETATRVCDVMAGAIELYASISGSAPDDDTFPESFMVGLRVCKPWTRVDDDNGDEQHKAMGMEL